MGLDITRIGPLGVAAAELSGVRWDLLWTAPLPPDPSELVLGLRAIAWFFCTGADAGYIGVTDRPDAQWQQHDGEWSQMAMLVELDSARQAVWVERHLIQSVRRHEATRPPERRRFVRQGLGQRSHLPGEGPWFVYACRL